VYMVCVCPLSKYQCLLTCACACACACVCVCVCVYARRCLREHTHSCLRVWVWPLWKERARTARAGLLLQLGSCYGEQVLFYEEHVLFYEEHVLFCGEHILFETHSILEHILWRTLSIPWRTLSILWRTLSTENTFYGLAPPFEHLLPIHVDALVSQRLGVASEGHVPRRLEILIIELPVKFPDEQLLLLLLVDSLVCVERLHHLLALELAQLRLLLKK